jgi:hypothetical protein
MRCPQQRNSKTVFSSFHIAIASTVVLIQVMPLLGGFGMCRQLAVWMHKNNSILVIPYDENGKDKRLSLNTFIRAKIACTRTHKL